jgi:4-hydroxybenzoate polyprenyltransferase
MKYYFTVLRPAHWCKNIFLFVGLVFGQKLLGPAQESIIAAASALAAFFFFSIGSSAIYIFNDIIDRNTDRLHPEKCKRPIASGAIDVTSAAILSIICAAVAIVGSYLLVNKLAIVIIVYIVLMLLYSLLFKRVMILDCIIISIGFCLRAIAGAVAVGVFISPWLIICTFALCLFLGFGKRRCEIIQLQENSEAFRKTLAGYTPELLSHMLDVTSGLAIVCFLMYAMDERTLNIFGTNNLVYTTPLVLYCVFRFSALVQKGQFSGPVKLILNDHPFQIGFILWGITCIAIIYADKLTKTFGNFWEF